MIESCRNIAKKMMFVNKSFYINADISRCIDRINEFNGLYDRYWDNLAIDILNLSIAISIMIVLFGDIYGIN